MAVGFALIRFQTAPVVAWWLKGSSDVKRTGPNAKHLKLVKKDDNDKPQYWH
jgi:hypothetical protein